MRNIKKRIISLFLILSICFSNYWGAHVSAKTDEETISSDEAFIIAQLHVGSTILLDKEIDNWHWGIKVEEPLPTYDISGNVSSYYCKITSENDDNQGYVIVGGNEGSAPIVEYATVGDFYPWIALGELSGDYVIYNGGYNYYIKKGDSLYDVSGFGYSCLVEEDNAAKIESGGFYKEEHKEEWLEWRRIIGSWSGGSNPPTSGAITNPNAYESNYMSHLSTYVTGYNKTYKTTLNFVGYTNHCAPVAATNLMLYWYYRNVSAYGSLRKYGDSTWGATFLEYYSLMHTTPGGTNSYYLAPAYNTYLYDAGITAVATYKPSPTWNYIKNELDAGRPMHVVVYDHYLYDDHSMITFGYSRFVYSGGYGSNYLLVADGRISSASRYIHTTVGSTDLDVVKVVIA